jgi:hypothetical protein
MLEEVYEQLLIERLELVDEFMDERQIVKSLKYYLMELKYQSPNLDYTYETLNTVLTNFYNYYNIEIEAGLIESVQINMNNMNPISIFNNILNLINLPLNMPPEVPQSEPQNENQNENQDENELNEVPYDESDDEHRDENQDDALLNQVPYDEHQDEPNEHNAHNAHNEHNEHNVNNPVFASNSFISVSLGGNEIQINTLNNNSDVNPLNIANLLNNFPLQYNMVPPQPILPSMNYMNFVTLLNNFMNQPIVPPNNYEDVLVTLDDKEFENLVSKKLEDKIEYDCAVCLESMVKDEMVTELKCNHTYHTSCIEPYLKQYNYKCPVCRADVGKHKYNI